MKIAEEKQLVAEMRNGSHSARTRLILANLPLVKNAANRRTVDGHSTFEDRVQDGCIGLIRSVDRFQPDRNTKLASYAVTAIYRTIEKTSRSDYIVRVPPTTLKNIKQGRSKRETVRKAKAAMKLVPLNEEAYSKTAPETEGGLAEELLRHATPRQRLMIRLHYLEGMKQTDIAQQFGVSPQSIQQTIDTGLRRARRGT